MRIIEYIGEILPDGHLSIPDEIRKELESYKANSLKVTISVDLINTKEGWEALIQLIENAENSGFLDVSEKHDEYL